MEQFNITKKEVTAFKVLLHLQKDENGRDKQNLYNKLLSFIVRKVIRADLREMSRALDYWAKHPETVEILLQLRAGA